MQWHKKDMDQYLQAKEYIDTIVMTLAPFQFSNDQELIKLTYQEELLHIFAAEITRELSGRTVQIPAYHYLKNSDKEIEISRMNEWIADCKKQPFAHFFILTFDAAWKKHEKALDGNLLWLPSVQLGDLHSKEMQQYIREQVMQISELIQSYWQNE
ncbi:DUF2487 family protein [Virgibacillus sp. 179-BFC.A HS]|uniref:DUF2487 family protein n=1 Tax=Tigheibacillus jepli TaxID=3035914 RepID=A0ABU5CHB0_9BACI|nr:DUF2487 family protein [Virgibacillus sp. 179-BFC.A HS]MDY0405708.1 DUF2487 family protein [Virgibacillus sp. 179-BFC.A HS]